MAQRRRNKGREVNGILLLDKTPAVTSNTTLQDVKRLFQAKKAGHTGSLDPLASGLLPICFGEATKLSGFLLNQDKRYEVLIRLGVTTSTADAEGEVLERKPVPALDEGWWKARWRAFAAISSKSPPCIRPSSTRGSAFTNWPARGSRWSGRRGRSPSTLCACWR